MYGVSFFFLVALYIRRQPRCELGFVPQNKPEARGLGSHTLLLVDLGSNVQVQQDNEDIAAQVDGANGVEDVGVVKGNALRHLHHAQHDDEVGAIEGRMLAHIVSRYRFDAHVLCTGAQEAMRLVIFPDGGGGGGRTHVHVQRKPRFTTHIWGLRPAIVKSINRWTGRRQRKG